MFKSIGVVEEATKSFFEKIKFSESPVFLSAIVACYTLSASCSSLEQTSWWIVFFASAFVLIWAVKRSFDLQFENPSENVVRIVRGTTVATTLYILSFSIGATQHDNLVYVVSIFVIGSNLVFFIMQKPSWVVGSKIGNRFITLAVLSNLFLYSAASTATQYGYRTGFRNAISSQLSSVWTNDPTKQEEIYACIAKTSFADNSFNNPFSFKTKNELIEFFDKFKIRFEKGLKDPDRPSSFFRFEESDFEILKRFVDDLRKQPDLGDKKKAYEILAKTTPPFSLENIQFFFVNSNQNFSNLSVNQIAINAERERYFIASVLLSVFWLFTFLNIVTIMFSPSKETD